MKVFQNKIKFHSPERLTRAMLRTAFGDIEPEEIDDIKRLITGRVLPCSWRDVESWVRACLHTPKLQAQVMLALNQILSGYGVEEIRLEDNVFGVASYVNTGDSYSTTIVFDYASDRYALCGWADAQEFYETKHRKLKGNH